MGKIGWYRSGAATLAAMFWVAFVALIFLVLLGLVPLDRYSTGAAVLFLVLGTVSSVNAS